MKIGRYHRLLLTLAVAIGLSANRAQAQISVTFTPDTQTDVPGATLNYSADFTDTDIVPYYIDGASFTSGSPYVGLLYSFFNGDPVNGDPITGAFEVMPGLTDSVMDVFSITLDPTLPIGSYLGTVTFTGQTASDYISGTGVDAAVGFQDVTAIAAVSTVPEPSVTLPLGLLSMSVLGGVLKHKLRKRRTV